MAHGLDLKRMCDNCRKFNPIGSIYYDLAESIEKLFNAEMRRVHLMAAK